MLLEAGRLISLVCWLRLYSFIIFRNRSHLLLPVPVKIREVEVTYSALHMFVFPHTVANTMDGSKSMLHSENLEDYGRELCSSALH